MQALNGGHVREFKGKTRHWRSVRSSFYQKADLVRPLLFAKLVLPPLKINQLFFRRLDKAVARCHGQLSMYRHNRHPVSPGAADFS